jgi:DNA-binding NarL/FixJ family response regulator
MNTIIVEDENIIVEMLTNFLIREFGFKIIGTATDGLQALELCKNLLPQMVIMDLVLPNMNGIELARRIINEFPSIRILALSTECDDFTIRELYTAGVHGYVDKQNMTSQILRDAIDLVAEGKSYYSEKANAVINRMLNDPKAYYKILSNRELQVITLIASGKSYEEIGIQLKISAFTARRHKHNAMMKIGVHDEASLLRFTLEKGILKHKMGLGWE